jgi:queuine tRNA-ribosyltransferase
LYKEAVTKTYASNQRIYRQFNQVANAIGGLSVGEPAEEMYAMTEVVCEILPKTNLSLFDGVGTPINILENIAQG